MDNMIYSDVMEASKIYYKLLMKTTLKKNETEPIHVLYCDYMIIQTRGEGPIKENAHELFVI